MTTYRTLIVVLALVIAVDAPGQTPIGGTITTNTTLSAGPYVVTSDLTVSNGATLTITPGVTLRFTLFTELVLNGGAISAVGTQGQPILFTADQASPGPGSWEGIRWTFQSQPAPPSMLRDCVVEFSGRANRPALDLAGGSNVGVTVEQVTVRDCQWDGVQIIFGGNPTLQSVTVEDAGRHGVRVSDASAAPIIDGLAVTNPGDYGVEISNAGAATSLTNGVIDNGIRFPNSSTFTAQVSGNTFNDYDAFPARMGPHLVGPFLAANTLTGIAPGTSTLDVLGGTVVQSATWPDLGIVYRITSNVDVRAVPPPTLTLAAGTVLQFTTGLSSIRVGLGGADTGTLVAQGTSTDPITLTTGNASPAPGQWQGITFNGAAPGNLLEHVVLEYGGTQQGSAVRVSSSELDVVSSTIRFSAGDGLTVTGTSRVGVTGSTISDHGRRGVRYQNTSPVPGNVFQNNVLANNAQAPLQIDGDGFPALGGNTYTNNGTQAVELTGGSTFSFTLVDEGVPYVVTDTLFMDVGANGVPPVLTVDPGVVLRFQAGRGIRLGSSGPADLVAVGTPANPITFTADSTTPTAGFWSTISFNVSTPASTMKHCVVEYGGGSSNVGSIVGCSSACIEQCTVRNSASAGLGMSFCAATVVSNTVTNNVTGIRAAATAGSSGSDRVINNDLSANGTGLTAIGSQPFVARGNWWGDASGPSGSGPGSGVPVTNTLFEPWLTQAPSALPAWRQVLVTPDVFPATTGEVTFSGEFNEAVSWTITVRDVSNTVVRTFTGSGTQFSQTWDGHDQGNVALADGTYTYTITGTGVASGQTLAPATGDLSIMSGTPAASITFPGDGEAVPSHQPLTVTGTAGAGYSLHIGVGLNPASYGLVAFGNSAVASGPLGTFSPQSFQPGPHTLRLTVGSGGNQTVLYRHFALDFITITNVSRTPVTIDPSQNETATIDYTLNQDADTVTFRFFSYPNLAPLSTETVTSVPAGQSSFTWDGRVAGTIAPDDGYFFTIEASNALGQTGTFNDASNPLLGPPTAWSNANVVGDQDFDAFRNDEVAISFTLNVPMLSTIQIHDQSSGSSLNSFRDILRDRPLGPGTYTVTWEGRRDDGSIHQGQFFPYYGVPVKLPLHVIVVDAPEPDIQGFRAEGYVVQAAFREVATLTYTLARDATVTITVTDPNGTLVRTLLSGVAQSAGPQSVEWDGLDDQGLPVAVEGDYRVDVTAVDAVLPRTATRTGTVVVYR